MGVAIEMGADEFEGYVHDALDSVPAELMGLLDNCVIVVEDDAPAADPELLGLYEGIPLTERDSWYGGVLPDRITIYRNPTLAICDTGHSGAIGWIIPSSSSVCFMTPFTKVSTNF